MFLGICVNQPGMAAVRRRGGAITTRGRHWSGGGGIRRGGSGSQWRIHRGGIEAEVGGPLRKSANPQLADSLNGNGVAIAASLPKSSGVVGTGLAGI